MHILLADDDPEILEPLEIALQREGHDVTTARNGLRAWELFLAERPDFAVLDVMIPGLDGMELAHRISRAGEPLVPVILLTGREAERDKVAALDLGADDYVVKPCSQRELLARIRAVWRRAGMASRSLTEGRMTIDPATHNVVVDGVPVDVTAIEFALLSVLIKRAGQVVRTNAIMKQVWGYAVSNDLLRMTVYRLRHKIEPDPKNPRYIHTVAGIGFMIRDTVATPSEAPGNAPQPI